MYKDISKSIRNFYLDGKHISIGTLVRIDTLTKDIVFSYGDVLDARIQVTKSKGRTFF